MTDYTRITVNEVTARVERTSIGSTGPRGPQGPPGDDAIYIGTDAPDPAIYRLWIKPQE